MNHSTEADIRLKIGPVVERAEEIVQRVRAELPTHEGLGRAAGGVAKSAREAEHVARRLRRPWGLHRLPALFLAVALVALTAWLYYRFLHVSTLKIALPTRDAVELHERIDTPGRVKLQLVEVPGSRDSAKLLTAGEVDVAFVQGGIALPRDLPRLEVPETEVLLFFLRDGVQGIREVDEILTSEAGQGSHTVALDFLKLWGREGRVKFLHTWRELTANVDYKIPASVDAVFVVKDLTGELTREGVRRLDAAGFRLATPAAGARVSRLGYLRPREIPAGYLLADPEVPAEPVRTYGVAAYLVARRGLTPRLLGEAAHLLDTDTHTLTELGFEPNFSEAKDIVEGIEAFLGILVYLGLAFLALLGIEITTYRRRFNELDSLVSLISMHQSNKDVLGLTDSAKRQENLLYLGLCSDLLALISVIAGYYSPENPSLLYNKLLEIIHHRSSALKLNIQLKILHASIDLATPRPTDGATTEILPVLHSPAPSGMMMEAN
jgi:hypothetical protein